MKCFSLFSGIGGFDLALRNQGHEITGACEIDRYARSVYAKQFPGVKIWENATKINTKELPDFEILCAGFPCQAFSIAGKRRGFDDTRGSLFFEIARIAKEKRPSILFLENVKGLLSHDKGQTFLTIIRTLDELGYNVQWQIINSKYFLPQNRERVFIVGNLRGKRSRKIFPIRNHDTEIKRKGGEKMKAVVNNNGILRTVENCTTLDANYFKGLDNHGQRTMIVIPVLTPDRIKKRQNGRRFKTNGEESFTLTAQDKHGIFDGTRIRRLTPLECERLQGFPDNWTKGISDTQRYKCIGNAVTVPVVEFIVKELFD